MRKSTRHNAFLPIRCEEMTAFFFIRYERMAPCYDLYGTKARVYTTQCTWCPRGKRKPDTQRCANSALTGMRLSRPWTVKRTLFVAQSLCLICIMHIRHKDGDSNTVNLYTCTLKRRTLQAFNRSPIFRNARCRPLIKRTKKKKQ